MPGVTPLSSADRVPAFLPIRDESRTAAEMLAASGFWAPESLARGGLASLDQVRRLGRPQQRHGGALQRSLLSTSGFGLSSQSCESTRSERLPPCPLPFHESKCGTIGPVFGQGTVPKPCSVIGWIPWPEVVARVRPVAPGFPQARPGSEQVGRGCRDLRPPAGSQFLIQRYFIGPCKDKAFFH